MRSPGGRLRKGAGSAGGAGGLPLWRHVRQWQLGNILHALAALDPAVGYCQGMDYMTAFALAVLDPGGGPPGQGAPGESADPLPPPNPFLINGLKSYKMHDLH